MKINSYKIIKYIFYILCIVSLFFSIKSKVNALDFTRIPLQLDTNNAQGWSQDNVNIYQQVSQGYSADYLIHLTNTNITNQDYVYITVYASSLEQVGTGTLSGSIDWQTTCTSHISGGDPDYYMTVYYADGSRATIQYSTWYEYCSRWDGGTSGINGLTATTTESMIDMNPNIKLSVVDNDGLATICERNQDTFKCPIRTGKNIRRLQLSLLHGGKITQGYKITVVRQTLIMNNESSQIISNANSNSQAIQNSINNTNNTIKDDSIDNNSTSSSTSSWSNMNANNGVITNLLTLPISLLQAYVNGMNSSCSAFSLGTLFNTEIVLPCINISGLIGSTLYGIIDVLFSGFMIYGISKKLIKIFNDFTNMKSNQVDELYGGGA